MSTEQKSTKNDATMKVHSLSRTQKSVQGWAKLSIDTAVKIAGWTICSFQFKVPVRGGERKI
jgi:hypothetical protein